MSILIRNGELQRTINSAGSKLVAVDFSNDGCPPCRMIHPFWESLVARYKNVVFCTVKCSECPTESQSYGITATPTFVFIRNGKVLEKFEGANKDKIIQCLEKHKEVFQGQGRKLDPIPNQEDFFASLQKKRHQQQSPTPDQQAQTPSQQTQTPSQQTQTPSQQAQTQELKIPDELLAELTDMGFKEEECRSAYSATKGGDIIAIIDYIQSVNNPEVNSQQPQPQPANEVPSSSQEAPQQSAKQEQVANDLTKPLDEEGEKAKQKLVEMGFDGELAHIAINSVGYENLDRCVEIIHKIERGEPIPTPKHKKTQAEFDATLARYKEIIAKKKEEEAAKVSPKAQANNELARRKQVLENIEMKKKYDEQQRQLAIEEQRKARIQDKIDRENVKKRIQAQREAQKKAQEAARAGASAAPPPQQQQQSRPAAAPGAKKPITDCTLRLQFPDGTAQIQKFKPENTIGDVERWIKANVASASGRNIVLESAFPKKDFTRANFGETLLDAQLCPRSQLLIRYV